MVIDNNRMLKQQYNVLQGGGVHGGGLYGMKP